ncbi:MAG: type II toxin-antitoxin system death-on-curing family toxin [Gammaproteobacteria bacterium]
MKIELISLHDVLEINEAICTMVNQESVCMDTGKVESALGTAFYPGNYPFQYGSIAKVAGALCYFLIKAHAFMDGNKRTAALAATMLMDLNGYELSYPLSIKDDITEFTYVIEMAASSSMSKEQLIAWFDHHKSNNSR